MSDPLCGPSNALQQLKQHNNVDRTLQQDRLASRRLPTQNFRSHNPNAGLLDPEFEAFQAGAPAYDFAQFRPEPSQSTLRPTAVLSATPSWLSDFSSVNISAPSPTGFQQQPLNVLQPGASSTAGWAQSFQQQHLGHRSQTTALSPQAFQYQARLGGFQSTLTPTSFAELAAARGRGKQIAQEEAFDEAAFERAFDAAVSDLGATDSTQKVADALKNDIADHQDNAAAWDEDRDIPLPEHTEFIEGVDPMEAVDQKSTKDEEIRSSTYEADALAATAQQLLRTVEHNQSEKFKNSQFLGLMRRLRDREVKVDGDEMVETVSATPKSLSSSLHLPTWPIVPESPSSFASATRRSPTVEFDTHFEKGSIEDFAFDHWESSLR